MQRTGLVRTGELLQDTAGMVRSDWDGRVSQRSGDTWQVSYAELRTAVESSGELKLNTAG